MREIKFRAARYEAVESVKVYDDLTGIDYDEEFEIYNARLKKGKWILNVIPLQFTGQKDKNGVEIYEGDIYHHGDPRITYTVVWVDSGLMGKQNSSTSYAGLKSWCDQIEVIGNIYENPELLEREVE